MFVACTDFDRSARAYAALLSSTWLLLCLALLSSLSSAPAVLRLRLFSDSQLLGSRLLCLRAALLGSRLWAWPAWLSAQLHMAQLATSGSAWLGTATTLGLATAQLGLATALVGCCSAELTAQLRPQPWLGTALAHAPEGLGSGGRFPTLKLGLAEKPICGAQARVATGATEATVAKAAEAPTMLNIA